MKELYDELRLQDVYEEQERESYDRIKAMVDKWKDELPEDMFLPHLNKIHKRSK